MVHELDLLELAVAWRSEGRRVALATVVATWGSSPRPPGSQLLADDSGRFMGSVSGGCIEGEVVRRALGVIETGEPELLEFGIADEDAWSVGLSCGGALFEEITIKDGRVEQNNFNDYRILRINEAPVVEVHLVKNAESPGGIGEPGTSAIAPAVTNPIFAATGKRVRKLPVKADELRSA